MKRKKSETLRLKKVGDTIEISEKDSYLIGGCIDSAIRVGSGFAPIRIGAGA
jgi:hypothetical protein